MMATGKTGCTNNNVPEHSVPMLIYLGAELTNTELKYSALDGKARLSWLKPCCGLEGAVCLSHVLSPKQASGAQKPVHKDIDVARHKSETSLHCRCDNSKIFLINKHIHSI